MGLPAMSYNKRARYTPQEEQDELLGMDKFSAWSPLAKSTVGNNDLGIAFSSQQQRVLPFTDLYHAVPQQDTTISHSSSPFDQLGEPLLLKILQMSEPTAWDLCRMSCVSRMWRKACSHSSFWSRLRVGTGSLRAGVEQLAPRCTALAELFIDDPRCELHILHPIIISCAHSLRRIVIDCDKDNSTRNEASISSLLWLLSLYCKNVESIELQSSGRDGTAGIGCLEGRTMWFMTSAFRNIRNFTCLAKASLTKQCVYLLAIAWRDLECLRINIDGVNTEDLLALRKCPNLRALELVGGTLNRISGQPPVAPAHSTGHQEEVVTGREEISSSEPREWSSHEGAAFRRKENIRVTQNPAGPTELLPRQQQSQPGGLLASMGGVFHQSVELLVLNRVEFDSETVAELALACPSLKRILVSGPLCDSCLEREGPCASGESDCVRNRVDCIQNTLAQIQVSMR